MVRWYLIEFKQCNLRTTNGVIPVKCVLLLINLNTFFAATIITSPCSAVHANGEISGVIGLV